MGKLSYIQDLDPGGTKEYDNLEVVQGLKLRNERHILRE
jgi:hypothetical protein